jgi:all-trans-retinol 13,14-reductase
MNEAGPSLPLPRGGSQTSPPASSSSDRFDVIVVGSGMGGLTCASLLAQLQQRRVLVLERHYRLGGFTHAFQRPGGRHWDVGLHYVGQMGDRDQPRALMDMVTGGHVRWHPMPSPFERYIYPDLRVDQPAGAEAYVEALARRWPSERSGVDAYFRDVRRTARWIGPYLLGQGGPAWMRMPARALARLGRRRALRTTGQVLARHVGDPALRSVLAAQWGDYGVPPGQSAFTTHATIVSHYLEGGWYPEGGASGIADGARAVIEAAGGACLTSQDVERVLVERGRAVGVRVRRVGGGEPAPRECHAPLVVSNAGARLTYGRLLASETGEAIRDVAARLQQLPAGYGVVQLFLGLRESPAGLGLQGENCWLFDDLDHDATFARRNELLEGRASTAYLSFPSLKDPAARAHTAEIIAPLDYGTVRGWADAPWRRRGADYEALKTRIATALLSLVERHLPGFGALVEYQELATPLSVEHFAAHADGAIYGLPAVPARYTVAGLGLTTPVEGLLMTGSDVAVHGIVGAMMGGVGTAAHIMGGTGFFRIMAAAGRRGR